LTDDLAAAVAVQPDGKVVVAGGGGSGSYVLGQSYSYDYDGSGFAVARYNPDGTPDSTFGTGGRASVASSDSPGAVAILPDGKILLVGGRTAVRYNADGTPDATFGTGGVLSPLPGAISGAAALAMLPGGKFLVGGVAGTDTAVA